jgi:Domain of unknown function (DUF4924)
MTIADRKYHENIAEYVLYVWQMQDLLRAVNLDVEALDGFLRSFIPAEDKIAEEKQWFFGIAQLMKKEGVVEKGSCSAVKEVINELNYLHNTLVTLLRDDTYLTALAKAEDNLLAYRQRSETAKQVSDVEACLTALYGLFVLRLRKEPISDETTEAMKTFSDLMAILSQNYHRLKQGEQVQHLN